MITKAQILQLPKGAYTNSNGELVVDNKFKIYIPLFCRAGESKNSKLSASTMYATLLYTPGCENGYRVGDVVYISFENNQMGEPVILGKLFLNNTQDIPNTTSLIGDNLNVSGKATLPIDTTIGEITGSQIEKLFRLVANNSNLLEKSLYEHNIVTMNDDNLNNVDEIVMFRILSNDPTPMTSADMAILLHDRGHNGITNCIPAVGRSADDSFYYDYDGGESTGYCESVVIGAYGTSNEELMMVIMSLNEDDAHKIYSASMYTNNWHDTVVKIF